MVVPPGEYKPDNVITWTPPTQIISLGTPSGTALSSMCIALSVVIEHIYHTEEQSEHNSVRLSFTRSNHMSTGHMVSGSLDGTVEPVSYTHLTLPTIYAV